MSNMDTPAHIVVAPRLGLRFTTACDHADPLAGRYEPCESCGTLVALHGAEWVESDFAVGCPIDDNDRVIGHSSNWTSHTPDQCRSVRGVVKRGVA